MTPCLKTKHGKERRKCKKEMVGTKSEKVGDVATLSLEVFVMICWRITTGSRKKEFKDKEDPAWGLGGI